MNEMRAARRRFQKSGADREIRVFVSSTFSDFTEEREELVKRVFPRLRRLCEGRDVTWGEVDLRWGITDEAKGEGRVLPLCLEEIDRCRPFFIGLLGERYGWLPDELPEDLLITRPWLREYQDHSLLALEFVHGALRNPKLAKHAYFYFRHPNYAAGREGFVEKEPARREKPAKLKSEVRNSGLRLRENFTTAQQLGEWVLADLTSLVEHLYPEDASRDVWARADWDHEAFAATRSRVFIGHPDLIQRLDEHAAGAGPPLVILGESGIGKSALLANWNRHWCE